MQLKEDFPSLKIVMLEQNYRSTSRILKCANILIANNPHVFTKELWSEMGHGDEIRVIRCRNETLKPNALPSKFSPNTCVRNVLTVILRFYTVVTTKPKSWN